MAWRRVSVKGGVDWFSAGCDNIWCTRVTLFLQSDDGGGHYDISKVFLAPPGFMLTLQCGMNYSEATGFGSDRPLALFRIQSDAPHRVSARHGYTPHMTYFFPSRVSYRGPELESSLQTLCSSAGCPASSSLVTSLPAGTHLTLWANVLKGYLGPILQTAWPRCRFSV